VRPRDEAVGDGFRVTQTPPLGHLDGVDVTDEVGDAGVGRRQLLEVALAAVLPGDRQVVAGIRGPADRLGRDRRVRVLAQLRARDDGRPLVQQTDQTAQQTGLALAAFAEQHDVVTGDQRALQLR